MIKLIVFLIILLTLGVSDVIKMRRDGLSREILPYAFLAATAALAAFAQFSGFFMRTGIITAAYRLFVTR